MAMSTGGDLEDNRLRSTAQRIIKSLRTPKDATDDMLLILSSFDNRLANISAATSAPAGDFFDELSHLDAAEKVILRHSHSSSLLFDADKDSSREFITAVDQILDVITDRDVQNNVEFMVIIQSILQSAMSKLENEFRRVLPPSAGALDPNRRPDSEISIDEEFHEEGGIIAGGVHADLVNPDIICYLRGIAGRMIRGGYVNECFGVYVRHRRQLLEEYLVSLGFERLGIEEVQRIEWSDLNETMKRWIQALKTLVTVILTREKHLCDQIFDDFESIREVFFVESTKVCIMQLLNFGQAVSVSTRSPEKLFRILDMYEALNDTLPYLKPLFDNDSGESVLSEAKGVLEGLGEAAKGTFAELEISVKGESSKKPVIGAGIHPLTRYMMNYVRLVVDYGETLNLLLESTVKESKRQTQNGNVSNGDEFGEASPLARRLMSLISSLETNLEEKAKHYGNKGMQCIFLMNNKLYILQKVKDSELGKLLGDDWVKTRRGILRKHSTSYLRASWEKVLVCLRDEGIRGLSENALKKAIKERLSNFNANFEEVYRIQTGWEVPDSQLRTELRISISENLISAYRSFLGWFGSQLQSERHVGKYIKYTAEDLDAYLDDLFEGRHAVLRHIRRRHS